jgi:ER membrane protein complex subunit 1
MIPPYQSFVGAYTHDIISYYMDVAEIRKFAAAGTSLESTSLVFAYGRDLFFMPITPAKAYDILGEHFNYPLLYMSVTAVLAATMASHFLAASKNLQHRWK